MPVRLKIFIPEPRHGSFREVSVLKASAGEYYAGLSGKASNINNGLHKSVVEFQRNLSARDPGPKVFEKIRDEVRPVELKTGGGSTGHRLRAGVLRRRLRAAGRLVADRVFDFGGQPHDLDGGVDVVVEDHRVLVDTAGQPVV